MFFRTWNLKRAYPFRQSAHIFCFLLLFSGLFFLSFRDSLSELAVPAAASPATGRVIVLDAGHGGEDPGAIGRDGTYEKDLNLSITLDVGRLLTEMGYTVVYTRTEDKLLYKESENIKGLRKISDLKNRCAVAAEYPEALFVSLHMNSFGDGRYSGLQVYYSEENGESSILAEAVQTEVRTVLQTENRRKTKPGKDIYVLEHTACPSILIECGFISNPDECEKLKNEEYRRRLAFAIVTGLVNYCQTK